MAAIHLHQTVQTDGEITLKGLPIKRGESVELILLSGPSEAPEPLRLTARQLRHSGLIGLWRDRADIKDSAVYARQLREQAQRRQV